MAIYRAVGSALVSEDQFKSLSTSQEIAEFLGGDPVEEFLLDHGRVSRSAVAAETIPFDEIGPNKPLLVQIRHVYTGRHPHRRKKRNLLLTSAMKSVAQFEAAPRAINFITASKHGAKAGLPTPAASDQGTPLVYYSPALTKNSSVITFELGFDNFDPSFIENVSGLLTAAAGIPAFIAQSPYLIGAGMVTKLATDIASRILEQGPVMKVTEPIDFVTPGGAIPEAGFRVLTQERLPAAVLRDYEVDGDGQFKDAVGKPYDGEIPYITISLSGTQVDDFKEFEPTQASAAILENFFNIRDDQDTAMGPILEGLKLYNDFKFRLEADEVKEKLEGLEDQNSPGAKALQERLEALTKNILQKALQP